jgi:hypothetical protein
MQHNFYTEYKREKLINIVSASLTGNTCDVRANNMTELRVYSE